MEFQNQDFNITSIPTQSMATKINGLDHTTGPYLRIVEQPTKCVRFRYAIEGPGAISPIKGVNSTPEHETYPVIEIVNYDKEVVVVVSCVTAAEPHRPHPNKLAGRNTDCQKYKNGICKLMLKEPPLSATFEHLGIQIVKRTDMEGSLEVRKKMNINPFKTLYNDHMGSDYNSNEVRLCFKAFINPTGMPYAWQPLKPVVTDLMTNKRAANETKIWRICSNAAKVTGGESLILLCEKVERSDIKIKFTEYDREGNIKWHAYADFKPEDVHKKTAITFKTPRYERTDISEPVQVFVQLERPSDERLSKPVGFQFTPEDCKSKRDNCNALPKNCEFSLNLEGSIGNMQ